MFALGVHVGVRRLSISAMFFFLCAADLSPARLFMPFQRSLVHAMFLRRLFVAHRDPLCPLHLGVSYPLSPDVGVGNIALLKLLLYSEQSCPHLSMQYPYIQAVEGEEATRHLEAGKELTRTCYQV